MCEEAPAVIYCVGYILPIGCCLAGACMSCYGCYRYYYASRMRRLHSGVNQSRQIVMEQPKVKRDTLKSRITERFLNLLGSKDNTSLDLELKDVSFKDLKESCPICLMDYEEDSSQIFIGLIKGCGHYFHFECIWEWLERKQTCPICREACELAETDIWGLSMKQVLDFINLNQEDNLTGFEEKKKALDLTGSPNLSGRNVVHIHLEAGSSGIDSQGDKAKSNRPISEQGRHNPAFQDDSSSTTGNDKQEADVTSQEITRT